MTHNTSCASQMNDKFKYENRTSQANLKGN